MISVSSTYLLCNVLVLILIFIALTSHTIASSATSSTRQQSSSSYSSKSQSEPQRYHHYHHLQSNIIPVKHLNLHEPVVTNDGGKAKNEFDRLNNRWYNKGRVTRAQLHEAVVKTTRHSHTNEIYVMGVASLN